MTIAPEISDEDPITLEEACAMMFRNKITPDTLRAEHRRGNLPFMRIGRVDFVTKAGIKGMMKTKCHSGESLPGSTSPQKSASGSSETDRTLNAPVAARVSAERLKKLSKNTSRAGSDQPSAKILQLNSQSPKS